MAPNILEEGMDGKFFELDALKGKIVLIDFWASYCGPCRKKHQLLVPLYDKYKDATFTNGNGFTVFSVSLDRNKENWIRAVERDGLKWPYHVSDLTGLISGKHKKAYMATFIPINYLIDGNGIITGKNLFGDELEETLKKSLESGKMK
ncbi:MAG: TlpA disulfide reductase family protein [Lentimicrobiaceae bacterium]|nr:TlpA disulfide reductase family protein [Lentimicrobiaceae bacterium]MDD4597087.1 TlpA disulfide reductase family protein [Lentimicrobiaceae bacterium]